VDKTNDNDLMEQVSAGKVEKLAILFEKHHVRLYNFFFRLTGRRNISEDLVQEVFIRILKYSSTYQARSKFVVWLYSIARNTHVDHLRKRKNEVPLDKQWYEMESPEASPAEKAEKSQEVVWLGHALGKLPLKKREALILSRYQGLKYKEIAELFGCQIGTVKVLVHRAIKELGKVYFELSGGTAL